MNPAGLLRQDITITRVSADGAADDHGNPTDTTTTTVVKGWMDQVGRGETESDGTVATELFRLYLEASAVIDTNDRVTVAGTTFEVDGPPWKAIHPRTLEATHIEATVRRSL